MCYDIPAQRIENIHETSVEQSSIISPVIVEYGSYDLDSLQTYLNLPDYTFHNMNYSN